MLALYHERDAVNNWQFQIDFSLLNIALCCLQGLYYTHQRLWHHIFRPHLTGAHEI